MKFIERLLDIEEQLMSLMKRDVGMENPSVQRKNELKIQTTCNHCGGEFDPNSQELKPVRDHNHYTGEILGMCHWVCNWNRDKARKRICVFGHNAESYDLHLIYLAIAELRARGDQRIRYLNVLPSNSEKNKTISLNSFSFKDSLAFLNFSLECLADDLILRGCSFDTLKKSFLCQTNDRFDKKKYDLCRNGKLGFCYEFCESFEKMKSCKTIPPHKEFYSSLTETRVDDNSYKNAKDFWVTFRCKNLIEFASLYCHLGVNQLFS